MQQYARERVRIAPEERARSRRAEPREQLNVWLAEDRRPDPQQANPAQGRPFLLVILGPDAERHPMPELARTAAQPEK